MFDIKSGRKNHWRSYCWYLCSYLFNLSSLVLSLGNLFSLEKRGSTAAPMDRLLQSKEIEGIDATRIRSCIGEQMTLAIEWEVSVEDANTLVILDLIDSQSSRNSNSVRCWGNRSWSAKTSVGREMWIRQVWTCTSPSDDVYWLIPFKSRSSVSFSCPLLYRPFLCPFTCIDCSSSRPNVNERASLTCHRTSINRSHSHRRTIRTCKCIISVCFLCCSSPSLMVMMMFIVWIFHWRSTMQKLSLPAAYPLIFIHGLIQLKSSSVRTFLSIEKKFNGWIWISVRSDRLWRHKSLLLSG